MLSILQKFLVVLLLASFFSFPLSYSQTWDWVSTGGSAFSDGFGDMTQDNQGNIIVVGTHEGNATFGSETLTYSPSNNYGDGFIVKYNSDGQVLWAEKITGDDEQTISGVSTDASGNIYISGSFYDEIDFGPVTYQATNNDYRDGFIAKFSASGSFLWSRRITGVEHIRPSQVKVDDQGNSYLIGSFEESANFGSGIVLTAEDRDDGFLAKFNSNGTTLWAKRIRGDHNEFINKLVINDIGELFISGRFRDEIYLGPSYFFQAQSSYDAFVAKFNPAGSVIWAKHLSAPFSPSTPGIGSDPSSGELWFSIFKRDSLTIDGQFFPPDTSLTEAFLVKLSSTGQIQWITEGPYYNHLSVTPGKMAYGVGGFRDSLVFGGDTTISQGFNDIVVGGYDSLGNELVFEVAGGPNNDVGISSHLTTDNRLLVAGYFITQTFFGAQQYYGGDREIFLANLNPQLAFIGQLPTICEFSDPIILSGGNPSGGIYSGPGVINDSLFDPSLTGPGIFTLTYDVNGISVSGDITVLPAPAVSWEPLDVLCETSFPFLLTGATPTGGIYSGTGINNGAFDPGIAGPGNHLLTYSFTGANGCSNTIEQTLEIETDIPTPQISLVGNDSLRSDISALAYSWYMNGSLLPNQTQQIQAASEGNYQVQASNQACESSISEPFEFISTSADKLFEIGPQLIVSPNPFTDHLHIQSLSSTPIDKLQLISLQGKVLHELDLFITEGQEESFLWNLPDLPSGVYFIHLRSESQSYYSKVLH